MRRLLLAASVIALPTFAHAQATPSINEIRIDQPGQDNDEYFELRGAPGGSLDGLSYIVIGDLPGVVPPQQNGGVEFALDLSGNEFDANGLFLVAKKSFSLPGTPNLIANLNFENFDNVTHMLVTDFTGAVGDDLDTDDDGVLDVTPWTELNDSVALVSVLDPDGFTADFYYSPIVVGPDGGAVPGHVWRCANVDEWQIGPYDPLEGEDTPGEPNFDCAGGGGDVIINELRIDMPGGDVDEYFELASAPGTSLDGLTYIVIGDGTTGSGTVEAAIALDGFVVPASGYFLAAEDDNTFGVVADLLTELNFENSDNVTHMLVEDFTGMVGDDLDTDDDCVLDVTPWTSILDSIALVETFGSGDCFYGDATVGPDGPFVPGQAYRCEPSGDWIVGSFAVGVTDTPGAPNLPCETFVCGGYDGRSCFEDRETGGCSDPRVCALVCEIDPTCCDVAWDAGCVSTAEGLAWAKSAPEGLQISEFRIKQPGADSDHYIEITGPAGTPLDGLSYVVLGDAGPDASGIAEYVLNLAGQVIPASGYFLVAEESFTLGVADLVWPIGFEDVYNQTHLLVLNFNGAAGADYDVENDCVLDIEPWAAVLDSVSVIGSTGCTYADEVVGPDATFTPGHAYRCTPELVWAVGAFDVAEGTDTPGAENLGCEATLSCGDPASGDCFQSNGTPYCSDGSCCEAVCAVDPICCEVEWDDACVAAAETLCLGGGDPPAVLVNEVRTDQPGADVDEYVELRGEAGTVLTGLTYIVIGDGQADQGSGVVEAAISLLGQVMPASGYFVIAEESFTLGTADLVTTVNFENGDNVTHMLVWNFLGEVGEDLDTDNDGVLDVTPWESIVDDFALVSSPDLPPAEGNDWFYSDTVIGPQDDVFVPSHVYRCDDTGPWTIGPYDVLEGFDTPGALNTACDETPCVGDFDGSGEVNGADLAVLLGAWNTTSPEADLDGDGTVGGADLALLLGAWGTCP